MVIFLALLKNLVLTCVMIKKMFKKKLKNSKKAKYEMGIFL